MIVTRTEPINKTKYAVSIDGEFAFVLYKGELHKYGIAQDRELPPHVYEEIMENVLPKRAKLRCMNLLKSREYTRQQMEEKLRQGKYPPPVIEEAIAYAESFGYINDEAYARRYVETYMETKSRRRMAVSYTHLDVYKRQKEDRQAELMELQQEIAFEKAENMKGKTLIAMIEGRVDGENAYVARTYKDAPNVDGLLFVNTSRELLTGDFVKVRITGSYEYDLIGELEDEFTE